MKTVFRTSMIILLISIVVVSSFAQDEKNNPAESITEAELRNHLFFLASDELEGRNTGEVGYNIAVKYAVTQLRASGVNAMWKDEAGTDSYLQPLPLMKISASPDNSLQLSFGSERTALELGKDFFIESNVISSPLNFSNRLVFAGYGIKDCENDWNDFMNMSLENDIPVIMFGAPTDSASAEKFGGWSGMALKVKTAEAKGAKAVVAVMDEGLFAMWDRYSRFLSGDKLVVGDNPSSRFFPEAKIPIIFLSKAVIDKTFVDQKFNPLTKAGEYDRFVLENSQLDLAYSLNSEKKSAPNVVGIIEGVDPLLKNEYIVLGAHLDHVGVRNGEVYNGADDNASGSVCVLEVAEAIAMAPINRSVIFVLFSGEEKGLLGSRHFVANSPVPHEKIKFMVNLEMLGRYDHREKGSNHMFAIISDHSKEILTSTLNEVNDAHFQFPFEISERFVGGSDHSAFERVKIPNITFAGSPPWATHPDYHQPGDDVEKIDFPALRNAAELVYQMMIKLADR